MNETLNPKPDRRGIAAAVPYGEIVIGGAGIIFSENELLKDLKRSGELEGTGVETLADMTTHYKEVMEAVQRAAVNNRAEIGADSAIGVIGLVLLVDGISRVIRGRSRGKG